MLKAVDTTPKAPTTTGITAVLMTVVSLKTNPDIYQYFLFLYPLHGDQLEQQYQLSRQFLINEYYIRPSG